MVLSPTNLFLIVIKFYGLPTATAETAIVFPAATGRNLGAGIFILILLVLGPLLILSAPSTSWI
jgi:hypothetical protein